MIETLARIAVGFVAALHLYFLVLEMFLWTRPYGRRVFHTTAEYAQASAPLAKNQGLYNGFLAAGLIWSLVAGEAAFSLQVFFLTCVVIAGIYGSLTANRIILWAQALPGAIALALVLIANRG